MELDTKLRIVARRREGLTFKQIAEDLGYHWTTVGDVYYKMTGETPPKRPTRDPKPKPIIPTQDYSHERHLVTRPGTHRCDLCGKLVRDGRKHECIKERPIIGEVRTSRWDGHIPERTNSGFPTTRMPISKAGRERR